MPEIPYSDIKKYIHDLSKTPPSPVYLVFGEEFFYQEAVRLIVGAIIPDPAGQRHNYDVIHPKEQGDMVDIIDRMNTYSFFSDKKIIELRDATLFVNKQNQDNLVKKIRQALDESGPEKAAPMFLNLLSRLNLDLSDLTDAVISDKFTTEEDLSADVEWVKKLAAFCRENNETVPAAGDDAERLRIAIEHGFPKSSFLIISTDTVDKRKGLYKAIKNGGVIIDCSVAKGNKKADQDAQRQFLRQHAGQVVAKHRKSLEPQAFEDMFQMIGFDLRTFSNSLEKLIDYAKDREKITKEDVQAVLIRTRQDPIYELTGAVSERNPVNALYHINSLLSSGYHYLQVLTAITNQVRKLMITRNFLESPAAKAWNPGMGFDRFKREIMPLVAKYDETTARQVHAHQVAFKGDKGVQNGNDAKASPKVATELVIAKNPNNPYPVYQQFLRAENYTTHELCSAFESLHKTDIKLKTTGLSPVRVLEELVLKICTKA
jgi:DNA polymerase-3 subunit delta